MGLVQETPDQSLVVELLTTDPMWILVALWLVAVAMALAAFRRRALARKLGRVHGIDLRPEPDGSEFIDVRPIRQSDALLWPRPED